MKREQSKAQQQYIQDFFKKNIFIIIDISIIIDINHFILIIYLFIYLFI